MRLIRLKIRNIASLKGEHEVDFLEIQKGSPLFAITGETGAGKSSVLNCLGLALYGEIYKKNINQVDVVTLGEKEGLIELIFQVKDKYYLADWRARVLKQNGEPYSTPQSPTRQLYEILGTEFSSQKTASNKTCAALLNLDFDQFCRCIILNQGEFAKFLNSTFKDRRDILEKLYPGEMLDNISKELETEKKALEKSKHDLEIELHTLKGDTLSGDLLKEQKKDLEAELKRFESLSTQVEKLHYHFESLETYHRKYAENEDRKRNIKADMALETTKYNHLLKASELLNDNYQKAKKDQETELPLLQTYLKKEETLKLLEEDWTKLKKRSDESVSGMTALDGKITVKVMEEETSLKALKSSEQELKLSLPSLKSARPHFETLFDLFTEKDLLQEEVKGKAERLKELEDSGKELKLQFETVETKIKAIPANVKELEKESEEKKRALSLRIDQKQRAEIKSQELKKGIDHSELEIKNLNEKTATLKILIQKTTEELFPLETTLKLQEVLNATEVCVDHALKEKIENCPVCESNVNAGKWNKLKDKLAATDLKSIRKRFDEGSKKLFNSQKESELFESRILSESEAKKTKELEWKGLSALRDEKLPTLTELDEALSVLKKQSWELASLNKELDLKKNELQKTREQYAKLKSEVTEKESKLHSKDQSLKELAVKLETIISIINRDTIRELKLEARHLNSFLEIEAKLEKITQEKSYLIDQKNRTTSELKGIQAEQDVQIKKINELKAELTTSLKGEKASDLIGKINLAAKLATDAWNRQVEDQKKQELVLKDSQGRLYQLDELTKDYDIHYSKELHAVKEMASADNLKPELKRLKDLDLNFGSPRELFIPLKDFLFTEKENAKTQTNQCRMNFASVSTRLADWEKLQDKIQLLELKAKDISDALARKMRLFEVLGKDELRTFVLSLVEENLIQQTNDELQKLCQGRYEIVHQTRSLKMTPEFFILDKFREGGKRKVSTLSGGETFMVSLAMALGLAEMTRGQAEIDSLFIDEGFGTLDQESLEDVLDMLQQIQTRGLMVGIISHIKSLTNALPVNLVLSKRADGTSSMSLQLN